MDYTKKLQNDEDIFIAFLKENYPFKEKSNLFLRDLQFAIKDFFKLKEIKIGYSDAEKSANEFAKLMVDKGILKQLSNTTWLVLEQVSNEQKKEEIKEEVTA